MTRQIHIDCCCKDSDAAVYLPSLEKNDLESRTIVISRLFDAIWRA